MSIATALNVATATIEGEDLAAIGRNMSLRVVNEGETYQLIGTPNEAFCATGKMARFSVTPPSNTGTCIVAANATSVLTIGGTDYLARVESYELNVANKYTPSHGVGDTWMSHVFVGQNVSGRCRLNLSLTVARALLTKAYSTTFSDLNVTLAFTLNGVAVSVALAVSELDHVINAGENQAWDVVFSPRAAASAPAGTTSMLEKVLNAPNTSQTLALQTKASTGGITYGGEFLPESYSLKVNRGQLISEEYNYLSTGAITEAASS